MIGDNAVEFGLAGLALLVVMQVLQLLPKRSNGEAALLKAVNEGNARICAALADLRTTMEGDLAKTRAIVVDVLKVVVDAHRSIQELYGWHAPDAEGQQSWKGISGLEKDLRGHIKADAEFYTRLEARLREIHGQMKKTGAV